MDPRLTLNSFSLEETSGKTATLKGANDLCSLRTYMYMYAGKECYQW